MMMLFEDYRVAIDSEVFLYEDLGKKLCDGDLRIALCSPDYMPNDELANASALLRKKGYASAVSFSGDLNDEFGNMYVLLHGESGFVTLPNNFSQIIFAVNQVVYTLMCPSYFNPYAAPAKKDKFFRKCTVQFSQFVNEVKPYKRVERPFGINFVSVRPRL